MVSGVLSPLCAMLLVLPGAATLHVVFGAHNIPHPGKAGKGGEDSFFYDDRLGTFGVADGVGGSAKDGVDPGAFSREMLDRCHQSACAGGGTFVPSITNALRLATSAPMSLGGRSTLLLGQLEAGTDTLRLLNLGDSGAMLLRPTIRHFGEHQVLFPRCVLRTQQQERGFNWPFAASAQNFGSVADEVDELSSAAREGDVLLAATDGVLDNLFDKDLQVCVSEQLTALMGADASAAQEAVSALARSIAERAHAVSLNQLDTGGPTPFDQAAAEEGFERRQAGGKVDDIAIVCGVVRDGARPGMRVMHNFHGAEADVVWLQRPGAAADVPADAGGARTRSGSATYSPGFGDNTLGRRNRLHGRGG